MSKTREIKMGDATLRIMASAEGYRGAILRMGKLSDIFEDHDEQRLIATLRNEAGKLHPDYVGYDGAVARFLKFFPDGFADARYLRDERDYKLRSASQLNETCSLEHVEAGAFDVDGARRAFQTNMLSVYEAARIREVLLGPNGKAFVEAAARMAHGDVAPALTAMERAISPHGRASWPMVTYLPMLWRPEAHMFLKPEKTVDFAQRVGHPFAHEYDAALDAAVYAALQELADDVRSHRASLEPADGIDIQSFIWVVGSYSDAELP